MSLYDTMNEKLTPVIDIGTAYTKFGFSGEGAPRCIIRSEIKSRITGDIRRIHQYENVQDLYDLLVDFIHLLYFKYALITPKDRPVIIVESLLGSIEFRETLAKVLFMHYEVPTVLMLPSHLVSLAPLALDTALVVDCGYKEIVTIPICHGVVLLHAWQAINLGTNQIYNNLKQFLIQENGVNSAQNLTESIVENIAIRCCFVTRLDRKNASNPIPDVNYPIGSAGTVKVPGKIREKLYEILYEEDLDHLSLSNSILDALLNVDLHLRRDLAANIVLIGGMAQTVGFQARLQAELRAQLKNDRYKKLDKIQDQFSFHTPPANANCTAWLGGAIYGATDMMHLRGITKAWYLKERRMPDWCNLKDNIRVSG